MWTADWGRKRSSSDSVVDCVVVGLWLAAGSWRQVQFCDFPSLLSSARITPIPKPLPLRRAAPGKATTVPSLPPGRHHVMVKTTIKSRSHLLTVGTKKLSCRLFFPPPCYSACKMNLPRLTGAVESRRVLSSRLLLLLMLLSVSPALAQEEKDGQLQKPHVWLNRTRSDPQSSSVIYAFL